jgi:gas vesicle protein
MRKRTKEIAVGTALAAGIGYLAGILTAPKSGKETRKDVERAAIKAKSEAEKTLKSLHSELGTIITQGKRHAKDLQKGAKTELADALSRAQIAKDKAREILSALHEGESDDRDLQKAIGDVNKALAHLKKYLAKDAKDEK